MRLAASISVFCALALGACVNLQTPQANVLQPSRFPAIGVVDERFQSYNVEMAEIVGSNFCAPYNADGSPPTDRFRQRPPLDLRGKTRLRNLARALGPAYMRVSGTWANGTYFQDDDASAPAAPAAGLGGVLTRAEWTGVVDFSNAVDAQIVTSFAINARARDVNGVWNPDRARRSI